MNNYNTVYPIAKYIVTVILYIEESLAMSLPTFY